MRNHTHTSILAACGHLLRPLARLLLKYGIGYREFSEVCKTAFVEVASEDYGIRGRAANVSKVAVLTGISRKETRKIRDGLAARSDELSQRGLSPASVVLRAWYSDPTYASVAGTPLSLSIEGRKPNLTMLVKRYAGDIPVKAIITELKRMGVLRTMPSERVRPAGKNFIPPNIDGQLFASGATSIHNLISTIANNAAPDSSSRLFERYAWSNHLPEALAGRFHSLVAERGLSFLDSIEEWLSKHEKPSSELAFQSNRNEIGVGVYFFNVKQRMTDP